MRNTDIDPLSKLSPDFPETHLREFSLLTLQGMLLTPVERAAAWAYVAVPAVPDEGSASRARSLAALPIERVRTVLAAGTPEGISARLEQP